jgi:outer membrane receptor protein involved in Fe transport
MTTLYPRSAAALLLAWALFAPTPAALAQDAPEDAGEDDESDGDLGELESLLDEAVVTTASRSAERATSAPATVFTISAEEIRAFGMRSIDEALNYLGIGFYSLRPRDYPTPADAGAQGVLLRDRGRHILVLLDGHVMNAQDTGHIFLQESLGVPLESIDHIEVMLGAGSVVYGSNAMLAVVNIVTQRANAMPGVRAVAELGIMAPTDVDGRPTAPSAEDQPGLRYRFGLGASAEFELRGSPAEVTINLEWLEEVSNTYRVPVFTDIARFDPWPGEITWGGAAQHSMQAPSVVASMTVGDFRLLAHAKHYRRTMPFASIFSDPNSVEERQAMHVDLMHEADLDEHLTLETRLYADYSFFTERTDWTNPLWCLPEHIEGCRFAQSSVGRWAGVEQQLTIDWDVDGTLVSTVGHDLRAVDSTGRPVDMYDRATNEALWTQPLPYFHRVNVLGAIFVQQIWQPSEWLELNAGARLDLDSGFGARVSPRVAASFYPSSDTSIRASYSEAFRAPTPYELEEFDATYRAPSPGLQPEVARAVEVEWQQRISWLTLDLRAFASFYEDMIDSRELTEQEFEEAVRTGGLFETADPTLALRYDNMGELRSFGGSFSFRARPAEGLTIAGAIAIADTQADGRRMPLVPVWMGNARVSYEFEPDGPTLALATLFAGNRLGFTDVWGFERQELGPQLDLRATFTAPIEPVPGLSMRLSFGYVVNARQPYVVDAPTEEEPDSNVTWLPVTNAFDGFLGLQYDVDP